MDLYECQFQSDSDFHPSIFYDTLEGVKMNIFYHHMLQLEDDGVVLKQVGDEYYFHVPCGDYTITKIDPKYIDNEAMLEFRLMLACEEGNLENAKKIFSSIQRRKVDVDVLLYRTKNEVVIDWLNKLYTSEQE